MMMNHKILVNIYVLKLNKYFEVYIAINERLVIIIEELLKAIGQIYDYDLQILKEHSIVLNMVTGVQYSLEQVIIDTDIRNGTKLLIL